MKTKTKTKLKRSLSQQVYDTLLERILRNEWVPGDMINRREVAAELKVSVAPTLEAMLQLEAEGLLETIPRKGTRIRIITEEDLRGQVILRQALEGQAARLYCGAPIVANEPRLVELAAAVDNSIINTWDNWDKEILFHRSLVELASCSVLLREFNKVMRLSLFFAANKLSSLSFNNRYDHIINLHTELVKKLQVSDPDVAERAMREHLYSGLLNL